MVDCYSRGRLDVGFVRGVPYEVSAVNSNPGRHADRMWEAHDLILKAWTTTTGRSTGRAATFNIGTSTFGRGSISTAPAVWFTGVSPISWRRSPQTVYVAATFLTGFNHTKRPSSTPTAISGRLGFEMPADRLAYAALVYVGDTDEAGLHDGASKLLWYFQANKVPQHFLIRRATRRSRPGAGCRKGEFFDEGGVSRRTVHARRHSLCRKSGYGMRADQTALRGGRWLRPSAGDGASRLPRATERSAASIAARDEVSPRLRELA